jgi:hypothetical protein
MCEAIFVRDASSRREPETAQKSRLLLPQPGGFEGGLLGGKDSVKGRAPPPGPGRRHRGRYCSARNSMPERER